MEDVRHVVFELDKLVGRQRFGVFEALPEAAAERLAADQLLVAAHLDASRIGRRVGGIGGIDVDQLHDPVGVRAGGGGVEAHADGSGEGKSESSGGVW